MVPSWWGPYYLHLFAPLPVGLAQLHAERGPGGASQVRSLQILERLASPIAWRSIPNMFFIVVQ